MVGALIGAASGSEAGAGSGPRGVRCGGSAGGGREKKGPYRRDRGGVRP